MSKRTILIIVIVLAIFGGVMYLLFMRDDRAPVPTVTNGQTEEKATPAGQATGTYIDYKPGIIAETSGTKLLFFHAPWCPQCRALDADIKAGDIPEGVSIIKVDYDDNQQLRREYGVTIQTSVVRVDDEGKLVEKFVAYDDPSLDSVVKELL